jgi:hypothetical protein
MTQKTFVLSPVIELCGDYYSTKILSLHSRTLFFTANLWIISGRQDREKVKIDPRFSNFRKLAVIESY